MKKIIHILLLIIIIASVGSCAGYKPVFKSSNLNFEISKYKITGDKKIGNKIYYKLNYLSKSFDNKSKNKKSYNFIIDVVKNKKAEVKNSAGKILYYRINLITNIVINDLDVNEEIFNEHFNLTSSFKVAAQHSETIKVENKLIEDLINKIFEDFIIKLTEKIS